MHTLTHTHTHTIYVRMTTHLKHPTRVRMRLAPLMGGRDFNVTINAPKTVCVCVNRYVYILWFWPWHLRRVA